MEESPGWHSTSASTRPHTDGPGQRRSTGVRSGPPIRASQQRNQTPQQRRRDLSNEEAAIRLCGAVVLDINDEWASAERRYFSEASMADLYPPRDDDDATPGELVRAE